MSDPEDQAALEDDLAASEGMDPSAEIGERSLLGSLANALLSVGRWAWKHKGKSVTAISGGYAALKWMVTKETAVNAFLMAYQGPYASWFKAFIDIVKPWL